jgi:hypothetical protein
MGMVLMSKRELNRIDILARLESGRLTSAAASALLRVSEHQVYRLMHRFRGDDPAGICEATLALLWQGQKLTMRCNNDHTR